MLANLFYTAGGSCVAFDVTLPHPVTLAFSGTVVGVSGLMIVLLCPAHRTYDVLYLSPKPVVA